MNGIWLCFGFLLLSCLGTVLAKEKIKIVVDADFIADDVKAISMALQHPDAELLAITTVSGCASVDHSVVNAARTLVANGKKGKVPIYMGAPNPIIGKYHLGDFEKLLFGTDGLGDLENEWPAVDQEMKEAYDKTIKGALALVKIFKEQKGKITLVCLGPLTNIGLAMKLDPDFGSYPKNVVVMGGTTHATGNTVNSTAEYNFFADPEAASIVLSEFTVPLTIVPWELAAAETDNPSIDYYKNLKLDVPLSKYFATVSKKGREFNKQFNRVWVYCDEVAMAVALEPEKVIKSTLTKKGWVELHGSYTRGQVALDWLNADNWKPDPANKNYGLKFVTEYDIKYVDQMIYDTIQRSKNTQNRRKHFVKN